MGMQQGRGTGDNESGKVDKYVDGELDERMRRRVNVRKNWEKNE
jgi:hypothetical protein